MDLTLAQQFELKRYQEAVKDARPEQLKRLLLDSIRLNMARQNIIKNLVTTGKPFKEE